LVLAAWFGYGIWLAIDKQFWGSLPFLFLFFASFAWVGTLSLAEWWQNSRAVPVLTPATAIKSERG